MARKILVRDRKNQTIVLPLLIEDCKVPELLKTKKYADFRSNYNDGLEDILYAIDRLLDRRSSEGGETK